MLELAIDKLIEFRKRYKINFIKSLIFSIFKIMRFSYFFLNVYWYNFFLSTKNCFLYN